MAEPMAPGGDHQQHLPKTEPRKPDYKGKLGACVEEAVLATAPAKGNFVYVESEQSQSFYVDTTNRDGTTNRIGGKVIAVDGQDGRVMVASIKGIPPEDKKDGEPGESTLVIVGVSPDGTLGADTDVQSTVRAGKASVTGKESQKVVDRVRSCYAPPSGP